MRWIGPAMLTLMLASCEGGGASSADLAALGDVASTDVPMLQDAVLLEAGGADLQDRDLLSADISKADTFADLVMNDMVAPGDPGPAWDVPAADSLEPSDVEGDVTFLPDAPRDRDATVGSPCGGPESQPCPPGSTCVNAPDGHAYCTPIDECSGEGAIDLKDLLILLVQGQGSIPVKVLAMPWPGEPACGPVTCGKDNPCCNKCRASLFIGDASAASPIVLNGKGMPIGCEGNDCNYLDACSPLLPKTWYWVWGRVAIIGGSPQFTVDGFCPADVPPAYR